jgi:hypothetical protein
MAKTLFDRIEVRAVGRQKALRRPGDFDCFTNAGDIMGTEIIRDDDVANVGARACTTEVCFAVDGAIGGVVSARLNASSMGCSASSSLYRISGIFGMAEIITIAHLHPR